MSIRHIYMHFIPEIWNMLQLLVTLLRQMYEFGFKSLQPSCIGIILTLQPKLKEDDINSIKNEKNDSWSSNSAAAFPLDDEGTG